MQLISGPCPDVGDDSCYLYQGSDDLDPYILLVEIKEVGKWGGVGTSSTHVESFSRCVVI